jgi:hypothetical protein
MVAVRLDVYDHVGNGNAGLLAILGGQVESEVSPIGSHHPRAQAIGVILCGCG